MAHDRVGSIHCDADGVIWFGTWGGGVSRYDGTLTPSPSPKGRGEQFVSFTTKDGLAGNSIWTIYRHSDGRIWFGTNGGVSCYNGKAFVNLTTKDGLAKNGVAPIYCDSNGVMWFGTDGAGVSLLEHEIYRSVALANEGSRIETYHFSSRVTHGESLIQEVLSEQANYRELVDRFQRRVIEEALHENNGNRSAAARQLGMDRANMVAVMRRLGIQA